MFSIFLWQFVKQITKELVFKLICFLGSSYHSILKHLCTSRMLIWALELQLPPSWLLDHSRNRELLALRANWRKCHRRKLDKYQRTVSKDRKQSFWHLPMMTSKSSPKSWKVSEIPKGSAFTSSLLVQRSCFCLSGTQFLQRVPKWSLTRQKGGMSPRLACPSTGLVGSGQ